MCRLPSGRDVVLAVIPAKAGIQIADMKRSSRDGHIN